jgi:hypothetical protein
MKIENVHSIFENIHIHFSFEYEYIYIVDIPSLNPIRNKERKSVKNKQKKRNEWKT